jgi:cytochrome c biogenesis protein CcmG/thiol:disulfide interchange protein DsbE
MADLRRASTGLTVAVVLLTACGGSAPGAGPSGAEVTSGEAPAVPAAGEAVPDIEVRAFDGDRVSLVDYAGTPMVVNFWASWCPPCIAEMPDLEAVHDQAAGRVTFVGVNTQDTPDRAGELVDETGVTYDLVRDPDARLFEAFGVFGMPSTFYVDADGIIVGRHTGLLTRDALVDDLDEHLGVDLGPRG